MQILMSIHACTEKQVQGVHNRTTKRKRKTMRITTLESIYKHTERKRKDEGPHKHKHNRKTRYIPQENQRQGQETIQTPRNKNKSRYKQQKTLMQ